MHTLSHSTFVQVYSATTLGVLTRIKRLVDSSIAQLGMLSDRARQRRQLVELTPSQLDDIGVSRHDALAEGSKPFWQA